MAHGIESIDASAYRQTLALFKDCLTLEFEEGLDRSRAADFGAYDSEEQAVALAKYVERGEDG